MADILIRRLDEETKSRLQQRARRHGRSLEAEIRSILKDAVADEQIAEKTPTQKGLGTLIMEQLGRSALTPTEWEEFERSLEETRRRSRPRDVDFGP
jgi:plasmid stability protein